MVSAPSCFLKETTTAVLRVPSSRLVRLGSPGVRGEVFAAMINPIAREKLTRRFFLSLPEHCYLISNVFESHVHSFESVRPTYPIA